MSNLFLSFAAHFGLSSKGKIFRTKCKSENTSNLCIGRAIKISEEYSHVYMKVSCEQFHIENIYVNVTEFRLMDSKV